MDKKLAENAVRGLLESFGENPQREELKKTPERVSRLFQNLLSGNEKSIKDILKVTNNIRHDEMVVIRDVPFYSLCEHHLMPFFGKCHMAYIPENNRVVGISRLAELVDALSKKLQLQEKLTAEIANSIMKHLKPKGAGVVIEARHLCMEMLGPKHPETRIVTSAVRGIFRNDPKTREEFLAHVK